MSNNLTPVRITDKNGKATTVHRKTRAPGANESTSIPAPASPAKMTARERGVAERDSLRKEIAEIISDPNTQGETNPDKVSKSLKSCGLEVLRAVADIARTIAASDIGEDDKTYEYWILGRSLHKKNKAPIFAASKNLPLVREGLYSRMASLHENLAARYDDISIVIDDIGNHTRAYEALRFSKAYRGQSSNLGEYIYDFAPLVSRYPDHTKQLVQYLIERGGVEGFDEQGFAEYLKVPSSLAEGSL